MTRFWRYSDGRTDQQAHTGLWVGVVTIIGMGLLWYFGT